MRSKDKAVSLVIVTFILVSLFVFLVAGRIIGWDFLGWFNTPDATWLYVVIGIFAFAALAVLVKEWISKI